VADHLAAAGLPVRPGEIPGSLPPPRKLLEIMHQDKKAEGGKLTFILARAVGEAFVARGVSEADVLSFLEEDMRPS
jgi:3-dehydroquinate synthetase